MCECIFLPQKLSAQKFNTEECFYEIIATASLVSHKNDADIEQVYPLLWLKY